MTASPFSSSPLALAPLLGEVTSVQDPDGLNRVQVKLHPLHGQDVQEGMLWARVAVPVAGGDRGTFLIPDVGDEVLVTFVNGDSRFPVVVGSMWNGKNSAPDSLPGSSVDRWLLKGKKGSIISIKEPESGQPTITVTTPGGVTVKLTDEGGGKIECTAGSESVKMEPSGITVQSAAKVTVSASSKVVIQAAQVKVEAGMVTVDAGMTKFSGVVKCDTLISTSVVSSSYTPGAGNVW